MMWHLANPALLLGLAGVAIPVVIHLLNRRRAEVIDWGAMQFLDIGRRARRRVELTELLLMAGRMLLLALVALAVARPFRTEAGSGDTTAAAGATAAPRDVAIVLDGSASMGRKAGGSTPRDRAIAWARAEAGRLAPGSTVAVLLAGDRVRPLVDPPSLDRRRVDEALKGAPPAIGASDLPAALAEALRVLDAGENPARDIFVLSDGQAFPWRAGEPRRWDLLRDLHREQARRSGVAARVVALDFAAGARPEGADGSVGPLELPRGVAPPGGRLTVRTTVANGGPGTLARAAELLVDGRPAPGQAQAVGPIPAGSKAPLRFEAAIAEPGSHLLTVRLAPGDDPLETNDAASRPVEITAALPVLLVDGERGAEPLSGETDFLRAALAPTGDDAPQVRATVVDASAFGPESLRGQKVLVLANVERLAPGQLAAVDRFLGDGGGVLVAPGDRCDPAFWNEQLTAAGLGWLPARLGDARGEPGGRREAVGHPSPASFRGPMLAPFASGDAPALAGADLFWYRTLIVPATAAPGAAVLARLDTGDPWIVERPSRKGRVVMLAGPVDAEGGTLPVNPDFVPLVHELVYHLADPAAGAGEARPGEAIVVDLDPPPPADRTDVAVQGPDGATFRAPVEREGAAARARLGPLGAPGIYRVTLPGGARYVSVAADAREDDPAPLSRAAAVGLAEGWPLTFPSDPARSGGPLARGAGGPRPIWRGLVLAALAGLCLEVWLTRRMVRQREGSAAA